MKKGFNYKIYKRTEKIFCSSSLDSGKIKCEDCYGEFKNEDCKQQHKKNQMCRLKIKCNKCDKWIRWFLKEDREKAINAHDCNKNITYCQSCENFHEFSDNCILGPKRQKQWEIFPKLCLISGCVSDNSLSNDCLVCEKNKKLCEVHEGKEQESNVNFMYILRENEMHGEFHGYFVTKKDIKYEKKQFSKPYEPKMNEPTVTKMKIARGGKPAKKKTLKEIRKFEVKNAMDVFIKNLLLDNDYENSVCLLHSSLMKFVIKSIGDMDLRIEASGNFQMVNLPWTNVSFMCIENYLKDYEKFAPNEKMTRYFPMHMNYEEFYNMNTLPQLEYFQFLSDSNEVLEKKQLFWKNMKAINKWNFMEQMKLYLF